MFEPCLRFLSSTLVVLHGDNCDIWHRYTESIVNGRGQGYQTDGHFEERERPIRRRDILSFGLP